MFSLVFQNKAMVIRTTDVSQLSSANIENLRHLVIQSLCNPHNRIVLDFQDIDKIDKTALLVLNRLYSLASKQGVILEFINVSYKINKILKSVDITNIIQATNTWNTAIGKELSVK